MTERVSNNKCEMLVYVKSKERTNFIIFNY